MKRSFIRFSFLFALLVFAPFAASAQEPDVSLRKEQKRQPNKMDLLRSLGLKPEQIRAIRQLNVGIRERRVAAQKALRDATGTLDDAIYADTFDDALWLRIINVRRAGRDSEENSRTDSCERILTT